MQRKDQKKNRNFGGPSKKIVSLVYGDEMRDYLESMVMDTYPDQVEIKTEESSGNEEEDDELQEEELDNKDKE